MVILTPRGKLQSPVGRKNAQELSVFSTLFLSVGKSSRTIRKLMETEGEHDPRSNQGIKPRAYFLMWRDSVDHSAMVSIVQTAFSPKEKKCTEWHYNVYHTYEYMWVCSPNPAQRGPRFDLGVKPGSLFCFIYLFIFTKMVKPGLTDYDLFTNNSHVNRHHSLTLTSVK